MIISKLKAKLKEKSSVQSQDQDEVEKFCSDFKRAAKKSPNLLKCLGFENFKHYVKFVLLESTCVIINYFHYSKLLKFLVYFDFSFFQFQVPRQCFILAAGFLGADISTPWCRSRWLQCSNHH